MGPLLFNNRRNGSLTGTGSAFDVSPHFPGDQSEQGQALIENVARNFMNVKQVVHHIVSRYLLCIKNPILWLAGSLDRC
jgi:hypothetical protein